MSLAPFLVALFLLRYLQRSWVPVLASGSWSRHVRNFLIIGFALLIIESIFDLEKVMQWVWHAILISIVLFMYKTDDLKHSRTILIGVIPFIIVSIFSDLLQLINMRWYISWESYIEAASVFSLIWFVALWINNKKQQKILETERVEREREEERRKILAARKEELELLVAQRTTELTKQKEDLVKALAELKSTQHQLIQQEKLASLGELTAGIAHEIQNPLNFVNNFSEVSSELLDELEEGHRNGVRSLSDEKEIIDTLKQNLEKIRHHGKRADAIVKGMLLHSRASNGKIEPVDINELTDEYLRLSYHGFRAKDKTFNATFETNFDPSIGEVNALPQDLGRVILNLLTNAFYSVNQKQKRNPDGYQPKIWVETKKLQDKVQIRIKDNGIGIPPKVLNKIYQPFFSTKPSGEGTGLGLSLSYDIITKGHKGEVKVDTKQGEFAEFNIFIPLNLS